MSFERYNTRCRIGPSGSGVVLPIDTMRIYPVAYVPAGSTVQELFDGRRKLNQPTFGYEIELTWKELLNHYGKIWDAINYMLSNDGATFYPHYDSDAGSFDETKSITDVIPDLAEKDFGIIFESRVRRKPASIRLVSKSQGDVQPKTWLTG